jgi:cytoskeletal protein CcmA (bactofilin family)
MQADTLTPPVTGEAEVYMWKRDEAVRPATPASGQPAAPQAPAPAGAPAPRAEASQNRERDNVNIGKSVVIKGELNGSEDLTIEGQVEGTIQLRDHILTIGANGRIKAQVFAKAVIVLGEVTGNVTASDKVDIRDNGSVDGDIVSPRVAIAEGAHFRGSVDMQRKAGQGTQAAKPAAATAATPAATTTAAPPQPARVGA